MNPLSSRLAFVAVLTALLAGSSALAGGFRDDFSEYQNTQQLKKNYGLAFFAGKGAGNGGKVTVDGHAVTLIASAVEDGKEVGAFALTKIVRKQKHLLGDKPDVTIAATFDKTSIANFGGAPVAPVTIGLIGRGGSPQLAAQLGVSRTGDPKGTLLVIITAKPGDTIVEKKIEAQGKLDGKPIVFSIKGDRIDLTVQGKSVIDGPIEHGLDLASHDLAKQQVQAFAQVQKNFGKQPRSATMSNFAVTDESSAKAISQKPAMRVVLTPANPGSSGKLLPALGPPRALSPDFIGFNGNLSSFDMPWNDAGLIEGTRSLYAGTIRYPAGSIGNVWDWDRGWAFEDLDYSRTIKWVENIKGSDKRYTLENLAKGTKEVPFTPVLMLNPVHHTLDEHLGHLRKLRDLGVEIKYVEFGNEYYFGRGADSYVFDKYPTARDYAQAANEWATAIKKEFPDARFAAVGSGGGDKTTSERRQNWNHDMVPVIGPQVDAITIHQYVGHGLDGLLEGNDMEAFNRSGGGGNRVAGPGAQRLIYEKLKTPEAIGYMLMQPVASWRQMHERTLIPDMPIWLTEFNLSDHTGVVRNTWAHGLFIAAYLDTFLQDPRVEIIHFHNIVGGNLFPALWGQNDLQEIVVYDDGGKPVTKDFDLTAAGLTMALFGKAMTGRTQARAITFAGGPTVTAGREGGNQTTTPLLFGWGFDNETAILVNASGQPVEINAPALGVSARMFEQYSGPAQTFVASPADLKRDAGRLGETLTLPAYSMTLMGEAKK